MIEINNISFKYPNNSTFQLSNISLKLGKGKILGIAGESGCGKSTLAKIICKLLRPTSGNITYHFNESNNSINPVQILFQNNEYLVNPRRKVKSILNDIKKPKVAREKLYEMIGITEKILSRQGYQLSGGERQKVALCRIMLTNPRILILDEPFSSQDYNSSINFISLFKKLQNEFKTTQIVISHDILLLKEFCNRIALMKSGVILEENTSDFIFFQSTLEYTNKLISTAYFEQNK